MEFEDTISYEEWKLTVGEVKVYADTATYEDEKLKKKHNIKDDWSTKNSWLGGLI